MPGVDFRAVRQTVTMAEVLRLLGYVPQVRSRDKLRGPCPVHRSRSATSRSLSVHLGRNLYHCFRCGASGNHLDLYAAVRHLGLYDAALELCTRCGREIPWIHRW